MFDNLSDKLNAIFKQLKGHGTLSEKNIQDGLKEVRLALLEADVHYKVVKKFVADIKDRHRFFAGLQRVTFIKYGSGLRGRPAGSSGGLHLGVSFEAHYPGRALGFHCERDGRHA